MKLKDLARVIRSKNAGPFHITLDIMFSDRCTYEKVRRTGVINVETVSRLYGVPLDVVRVYEYGAAWSFKISFPRRVYSGDIGDSDIYGAQQHAPLMDIEIPTHV